MHSFPLHLLETLRVFAQKKTLQETAEALQLTQPAVTKHLQQLEELSPFPLFEVVGRRKRLSHFGQEIAAAAAKNLQNLSRDINAIAMNHSDGQYARLTIGGRLEFIVRYLEGVRNFQGRIEFFDRSSSDVIKDLLEQRLDIAITHRTNEKLEYLQKKIASDRACLLIPRSWDVPIELKAFLKQAANLPTAIYSEEIMKTDFSKEFTRQLSHLNIKLVISDWVQIEEWVHQQKVWAVLPKLFSQNDRNYRIVDLQESTSFHNYYIYYRPELAKLAWFQNLLKEILA